MGSNFEKAGIDKHKAIMILFILILFLFIGNHIIEHHSNDEGKILINYFEKFILHI